MPQTAINRTRTGAEILYGTSKGHRRVLFLELMAWAITQAEDDDTVEFRDELKQHRKSIWGSRPWAGAASDEEEFLAHVADMARVFAGCDGAGGAWYPNRKSGPLTGQDL